MEGRQVKHPRTSYPPTGGHEVLNVRSCAAFIDLIICGGAAADAELNRSGIGAI